MSKGPWKRDIDTGLPPNQIDYLTDGKLDLSRFPDCNVFHVNTVTWLAAGLRPGQKPNVTRIRDRLLGDPRFPCNPILNEDGKIVAMPTNTATVQAWRELDRADRIANERAGKPLMTNVG